MRARAGCANERGLARRRRPRHRAQRVLALAGGDRQRAMIVPGRPAADRLLRDYFSDLVPEPPPADPTVVQGRAAPDRVHGGGLEAFLLTHATGRVMEPVMGVHPGGALDDYGERSATERFFLVLEASSS